VIVTATNSGGSSSAASSVTDGVANAGPTNTAAPTISGTAAQSGGLTANPGQWSHRGALRFAFRWQRCDAGGAACADIPGATAQTYTLGAADVGHRLSVVVVASDSRGSTQALAPPSAVVTTQSKPANATGPSVGGEAQAGQHLVARLGQWSGTAIVFTFQWRRCDPNGNACADIAGATKSSYLMTGADVGRRLRVLVMGSNAAGRSSALSSPSGVVIPAAPSAPSRPSSGTTSVSVAAVILPTRLVVSRVEFEPARIHSRSTPLVARFRVMDTLGHPVRGALVYAIGVPSNRVSFRGERSTDANGWATFTYRVLRALPMKEGARLTFFVRARKPGENVLAGVSTRRLVSVAVSPR
jgi:hypothetical protein